MGHVLGMYAEAQVREKIVELFAERGIQVPATTLQYSSRDNKGDSFYEVDILLYDTDFAIIVEVKTKLGD